MTPVSRNSGERDGALTWEGDERCIVGDSVFQILPADLLEQENPAISMEGADFLLFKSRWLIERYVSLLDELRPRNVIELGILEGGSAALLYELARPNRLVTIDRKPPTVTALRDFVAARDLEDELRIHTDVDQGDRARLSEIVADAFGDEPLDLVVDDCSHLYEPTRASFNELFPRLRPGGVYSIEDWPWAHEGPFEELWADEVPLTRLVFEILLAIPGVPGLIAEVNVDPQSVNVTRGEARIDPTGFQISDCSNPRGRKLLADEQG